MTIKKETDTATEEEADAETTEEETEEETAEESEEETEEESEEEEAESSDKERDYDAEIEEERTKGKPDPKKAKDAFKERKEKKQEDEDDEDRPISKRDLAEILATDRKERLESSALTAARKLAGSDKEAQLIVEKWKNRSFPESLSLEKQIEEAYVITHSKKLIGERNEAVRALKNKGNVDKSASSAHRDGPQPGEPKLSPQDAVVIKQSGFKWIGTSRRYEKKLANGSILVKDPKTKAVTLIRKK